MIFFPKLLTMDLHNDLDFLLDLLLFCQIYVSYMAYKLHQKLRKLLIPPNGYINCGEKDSAMARLESIREGKKPEIQRMNIFFFYLHFLFIIRFGVSCAITQRTLLDTCIRSWLQRLDWFPIEPFLHYITFFLELLTVIPCLFIILWEFEAHKPEEKKERDN